MEVQGRNCVSLNFGEFSNSSSDLGSVYIIFLVHLSCFDECSAFVKQKKEKKKESFQQGSITNLLKGHFLSSTWEIQSFPCQWHK